MRVAPCYCSQWHTKLKHVRVYTTKSPYCIKSGLSLFLIKAPATSLVTLLSLVISFAWG